MGRAPLIAIDQQSAEAEEHAQLLRRFRNGARFPVSAPPTGAGARGFLLARHHSCGHSPYFALPFRPEASHPAALPHAEFQGQDGSTRDVTTALGPPHHLQQPTGQESPSKLNSIEPNFDSIR